MSLQNDQPYHASFRNHAGTRPLASTRSRFPIAGQSTGFAELEPASACGFALGPTVLEPVVLDAAREVACAVGSLDADLGCSGYLVTDNTFITAQHCFGGNDRVGDSYDVHFGYWNDRDAEIDHYRHRLRSLGVIIDREHEFYQDWTCRIEYILESRDWVRMVCDSKQVSVDALDKPSPAAELYPGQLWGIVDSQPVTPQNIAYLDEIDLLHYQNLPPPDDEHQAVVISTSGFVVDDDHCPWFTTCGRYFAHSGNAHPGSSGGAIVRNAGNTVFGTYKGSHVAGLRCLDAHIERSTWAVQPVISNFCEGIGSYNPPGTNAILEREPPADAPTVFSGHFTTPAGGDPSAEPDPMYCPDGYFASALFGKTAPSPGFNVEQLGVVCQEWSPTSHWTDALSAVLATPFCGSRWHRFIHDENDDEDYEFINGVCWPASEGTSFSRYANYENTNLADYSLVEDISGGVHWSDGGVHWCGPGYYVRGIRGMADEDHIYSIDSVECVPLEEPWEAIWRPIYNIGHGDGGWGFELSCGFDEVVIGIDANASEILYGLRLVCGDLEWLP